MARPQQPWYRSSKKTWYATIDGKTVSLGVKGEAGKKAAYSEWHRRIAAGAAPAVPKPSTVTVANVIEQFLADAESRTARKTIRSYRYFLTPFADAHGTILANDLRATVAEAYSRKATWQPQTRGSFLTSLVTAFRWAERAGLIDRHQLRHVRKPPKASRGANALLSPEEQCRIIDAASPSFRMFLKVLQGTGCRPGEAAAINGKNFDATAGVVRLQHHKTAYRGVQRVIYLPPEIVALLQRQQERYPDSELLRNNYGEPWSET